MVSQFWPPLTGLWPNLPRCSAPQAAFLSLDCKEAFYGGAAGGGKSDALLAAALQYVDRPGYAALIIRRTFADLNIQGAAMNRAQQWLAGKAHWSAQDKKFTFPSGATLTFGYLQTDADMFRYQSAEFTFIGFDELTQFSERQYRWMFNRLRALDTVGVPLRMRSASNPGGIGHGWVKRRFITARQPGTIFIPAKLQDHPDETFKRGYRDSLSELDDVTRRQYEDGDWDVAAGLAFHVMPDVHLISDMEIPESWQRFESMDFGVANPTCLIAWAVDYDGNVIAHDMYYKGETLVSDHAAAIEAKRRVWWPEGQSPICWADPSMWNRKGGTSRWGEPASDVTAFQEFDVDGLVQANNAARPGRIRVAEFLKPDPTRLFPSYHKLAGETGSPRFFINSARCLEMIEQLQVAPLMPVESGKVGAGEIVDPDWEGNHGHAVAATRYGLMSRNQPSVEPYEPLPDARAELLRKARERRTNPALGQYQNV